MTTYSYPTYTSSVSDTFQDHVNRGSVNPGVDYVSAYGSTVYAVAAGTVTDASNDNGGGGGRTIHVDHDDGSGADYLHLDSVGVYAGQWVSQGSVIGVSGASGYGEDWYYGPHLHISFRYNHAHGYGNSGNVDFDAIMTAQGGVAPTPGPSAIGEDMSNIIHHPNGSLGLAGSDGSFTVLTSMDQVNSLIATGAVPADDSKWVWAADGLMWNMLQQVASRRSTANNPAPYTPPPTSQSAGVSTAQWVIGGVGLLLVLLGVVAVPLILAGTTGDAGDLGSLGKFLVAGGLALLGVAAGSLTWAQVRSRRGRHAGDSDSDISTQPEPVPIYRPGTQP
jgi:murein DD-endopeptidase MepM/ murein hydrolase activator NlpD